MSVRRLIRTLIDRLDVNPDLLMMALTKGNFTYETNLLNIPNYYVLHLIKGGKGRGGGRNI